MTGKMNTDPLTRQFEALQERVRTYDYPDGNSARGKLLEEVLRVCSVVTLGDEDTGSFLAIGESMLRILDMKNEDAAEMSLELYRDRVRSLLENKA
jgi:hypothetical protein